MRFVLDNDVPVSVRAMLQRYGHESWSAHEAGLAEAEDDDLTVYAVERRSVLVSLDAQFMQRRRANAIGRHVRLRCPEPDAAMVLAGHLKEVLDYLERDHVTVTVSRDGGEGGQRLGLAFVRAWHPPEDLPLLAGTR